MDIQVSPFIPRTFSQGRSTQNRISEQGDSDFLVMLSNDVVEGDSEDLLADKATTNLACDTDSACSSPILKETAITVFEDYIQFAVNSEMDSERSQKVDATTQSYSRVLAEIYEGKEEPVSYRMGVTAMNVLIGNDDFSVGLVSLNMTQQPIELGCVPNLYHIFPTNSMNDSNFAPEAMAYNELISTNIADGRSQLNFIFSKAASSSIHSTLPVLFTANEILREQLKKSFHILATNDDGAVVVIRDKELDGDHVNLGTTALELAKSIPGIDIRRVIINGKIVVE